MFPAIDINKSGTRREDLLLDQNELQTIWQLRKALSNYPVDYVTEKFLSGLLSTRTNMDFMDNAREIMDLDKIKR